MAKDDDRPMSREEFAEACRRGGLEVIGYLDNNSSVRRAGEGETKKVIETYRDLERTTDADGKPMTDEALTETLRRNGIEIEPEN